MRHNQGGHRPCSAGAPNQRPRIEEHHNLSYRKPAAARGLIVLRAWWMARAHRVHAVACPRHQHWLQGCHTGCRPWSFRGVHGGVQEHAIAHGHQGLALDVVLAEHPLTTTTAAAAAARICGNGRCQQQVDVPSSRRKHGTEVLQPACSGHVEYT